MTLEEAVAELRVSLLSGIPDILASLVATVRDEALEEAAKRAARCYHGPGDYGCAHGGEIATEIRALKSQESAKGNR